MNICPVCKNLLESHDSVCAVCGFRLLGTTQRFEPVSIPDSSSREVTNSQSVTTLHVVKGPQIGQVFTLGNTALTIGRSPLSDIFLNDMTVSRSHALIAPINGGYMISDENSYNGVWVNNRGIDACKLENNDVIQLGAFSLIYQED